MASFVSAAMKTPWSRSNASYIQSIQKTPTALSDDARCGLAAILDRQHKESHERPNHVVQKRHQTPVGRPGN